LAWQYVLCDTFIDLEPDGLCLQFLKNLAPVNSFAQFNIGHPFDMVKVAHMVVSQLLAWIIIINLIDGVLSDLCWERSRMYLLL
jgi:hypothetical protein